MSTTNNGTDSTAATDDVEGAATDAVEDVKVRSATMIDFNETIERLKLRAIDARRQSKSNKINSTFVAIFAVTALLMVVVGAEDVVRRRLVPWQ